MLTDLINATPGVTDASVSREDIGTWFVSGKYGEVEFTYRPSFDPGHEAEAARQVASLLAAEHPEVRVG